MHGLYHSQQYTHMYALFETCKTCSPLEHAVIFLEIRGVWLVCGRRWEWATQCFARIDVLHLLRDQGGHCAWTVDLRVIIGTSQISIYLNTDIAQCWIWCQRHVHWLSTAAYVTAHEYIIHYENGWVLLYMLCYCKVPTLKQLLHRLCSAEWGVHYEQDINC